MVLDTSLLNTQHYKVQNKGKVEQSKERSCAPLHFVVVAIEKAAFMSPSTTVTNFILLYMISSSSSCRAASTYIPDPLSPLLPIVHRFWQVLMATSHIPTELLYVYSSWPSCFCSAICRGLIWYKQMHFNWFHILYSSEVSRIWRKSEFDGEVPVLEIWRVWSTPSLPLLVCPFWSGVVVPLRVPSMDQIDLLKNYSYLIWPCPKKILFFFYKKSRIQFWRSAEWGVIHQLQSSQFWTVHESW